MTKYEINTLRIDGTCDLCYCNSDTPPVPPNSGDRWDIPGSPDDVDNLFGVAMIEIVGVEPTPKPWSVWPVGFSFVGDAEDRNYHVIGVPLSPNSGTWWAMRASRGDCDAGEPKNAIYIRRANLLSIEVAEIPTTCE